MKYRKKPVVVEAFQFQPIFNANILQFFATKHEPLWFAEAICSGKCKIWNDDEEPYLMIDTLEGRMKANVGNWIIKGVNGEIYPCKPDIFEKTYELVEA